MKSIRTKTTLLFTGFMLLAISSVAVLLYLKNRDTVIKQYQSYLINTIDQYAEDIYEVQDTYGNTMQMGPSVDGLFLAPHLGVTEMNNNLQIGIIPDEDSGKSGVVFVPKTGESDVFLVFSEGDFHEDRIIKTVIKHKTYYVYDRKLEHVTESGFPLWIRGVIPEDKMFSELNLIYRHSFLLMAFLLILTFLISWFVSGRMLKPIKKLSHEISEIVTEDDLKKRVETDSESEIRLLTHSFNMMMERLQTSFEAEKQFTVDVSHELRTPVSVILLESENTLARQKIPEEMEEPIKTITRQARKMKATIEDMLLYGRLERNMEKYPFETIDLSELVSEVAEDMGYLSQNHITLTADIDEGVCISGNSQLLERLLQNLIMNAYQYGKMNGHIQVSLKKEKNTIILSVEDDGQGIPEEDQQKIFERFYRGKNAQNRNGNGLGLSIVKKIADLHHGTIEVESSPGKGSIFNVKFQTF